MRSVLKTCQLELKVKGPVFVGSGYETVSYTHLTLPTTPYV